MNTYWTGKAAMRRRALGLVASALFLCAGSAWGESNASCRSDDPDIVCTKQGAIRGVHENGTLAFKGIPYAKPPVGELRWQPPQHPERWQGVRDGSAFGAICPQLNGSIVVGDEDCLTLNVWKPEQATDQKLPVMVFLTGGGNHANSGQGSGGFGGVNYNGHALAPKGVVYVSFNIRLGALGFLAVDPANDHRRDRISGNYGSMDQIAMLRWLHRNIAAFGGDPRRITLFGTSAGGGNICALMTSPHARGLFHRASMQASVPTGCEIQTLEDAENGTGAQVLQVLGCDSGACLRGKSMEEIVSAVPGTFGVFPRLYGPAVDGKLFREQPLAIIKRGAHSRMPVIIGNSTEETMQFVNAAGPVTDDATYEAAIAAVFGAANMPAIRDAYPPANYPTHRAAFVQLTTDGLFTCQSRRVARALVRNQKQPVYRYLFDHALENDPVLAAQGAVHTIEHAFFFDWQGSYVPTADDLAIQELMLEHWTEFARTGKTSDDIDPAWPQVRAQGAYLRIAAQSEVEHGAAEAQCAFWDTVSLPWPHL